VSGADIAERAYEIYLERGCADGFDRDDWFRAEHDLKNPRTAVTESPRRRKSQAAQFLIRPIANWRAAASRARTKRGEARKPRLSETPPMPAIDYLSMANSQLLCKHS